jgi:predicted O-methyltransferase YrrM
MPNYSRTPSDIAQLIDRFFELPMKPDRKMEMHDITRSSLRRAEAFALADLVCDLKPEKSLEIGLAEAGSCVAISAARRHFQLPARHIVLDPFQETLTHGAGLIELERLGLRDAVQWQAERSEYYLHDRLKDGEADIDFAFVDGGHDVGQKISDAFYLNKVLRPGGVVVFHDALLISTAMAVYYLAKECGYSIVALPADNNFLRVMRSLRHIFRLGLWYSTRVIPKICQSLVALQKPERP